MSYITLIAAVGKNLELGKDNTLIWSIPEDLKFFRENTLGKYIVMGMNTFVSLPKLLPNRKHVVITRREIELDNVMVVHNINELLEFISGLSEEVMIIGGAQIYSQMIRYADKMLLTEIDSTANADVYFPKFNKATPTLKSFAKPNFLKEDWDMEILSQNSYENIKYSHVSYSRKRVKK